MEAHIFPPLRSTADSGAQEAVEGPLIPPPLGAPEVLHGGVAFRGGGSFCYPRDGGHYVGVERIRCHSAFAVSLAALLRGERRETSDGCPIRPCSGWRSERMAGNEDSTDANEEEEEEEMEEVRLISESPRHGDVIYSRDALLEVSTKTFLALSGRR